MLHTLQTDLREKYKINDFDLFHNKIKYVNNTNDFREMTSINLNDPIFQDEKIYDKKLIKNIKTYLFRKLNDYEGEKEYRIAIYHKSFESKKEIFLPFNDGLVAVIFGSKFKWTYRINFEKYKEEFGFDLFSTYWSNGEFSLSLIHKD